MHTASPLSPVRTVPTSPPTFVDVDLAAGLLRGFINAVEMEGGSRTPVMAFAKLRAEQQLRMWGVDL